MANEPVIAGYFYWKHGLRGPASERIPIDSDTPHPYPYLLKVPLNEGEMNLSLLILEKRFPLPDEDAA